MTADTPLLLSSKAAAAMLAVSERTLFTLVKEGRINAVRIGARCVRFRGKDRRTKATPKSHEINYFMQSNFKL